MKPKLAKTLNVIFLTLGLALLVNLLVHLDYQEVGTRLVQVGFGYFSLLFIFYVLGMIVTTAAWRNMISAERSDVGFLRLFGVFWAGHAVNSVTPTGSLGEILKGSLLKGRVEGEELVASLIVFNFFSTLSMQVFTLLGPLVCLFFLDLPAQVTAVLFTVAFAFFIPTAFIYILLRLGVTSRLLRLVTKLPFVKFKDPDALYAKARTVDKRIKEFRTERPGALARAVFWLTLARLFQVIEVWVVLIPLLPGTDLGWLFLLSILSQTSRQLISWVATFIPGQIGVAEGGGALLYKFLGLDPVIGFSMELVRRIRLLIGIAAGLIIGWVLGLRRS